MATLTIRDLPEETMRALKAQAVAHGHSMEAEARAILQAVVSQQPDFVTPWLDSAESVRGDFDPPPRSKARAAQLER